MLKILQNLINKYYHESIYIYFISITNMNSKHKDHFIIKTGY
jgi:hypothetical protein